MWPFNRKKKPKAFDYHTDEVQPLATGRGGCIASNRATVDGFGVFYMYRSAPINDVDSGWAFLHGSEDDAYMDDATNHKIFDVNTIANINPAIIPHLDAPIGSAFHWDGEKFVPDPYGAPDRDETLQ
jgi:hypothetical protein